MCYQASPSKRHGSGAENMRTRPKFIIYLIGSQELVERMQKILPLANITSDLVAVTLEGGNLPTDGVSLSQDQGAKLQSQNTCLAIVITDTTLDKSKLWELCQNCATCMLHPRRTAVLRVGTKAKGEISVSGNCSPDDLQTIISLLRRNLELSCSLRKKHILVKSICSIANRDPLTGLANRRGWKITIKRLWREAVEKSRFLLVALFDLDGFKKINDQFGHAFGDQVLKSVAKKAHEACREGDLLARWGGDEMALAVLLPDKSLACQIVERIRSRLQLVFPPMNVPITASAGYVVVQPEEPWNDKWEEQLLKSADAALAQAKTSRGRPVCEGTLGSSTEQKNPS